MSDKWVTWDEDKYAMPSSFWIDWLDEYLERLAQRHAEQMAEHRYPGFRKEVDAQEFAETEMRVAHSYAKIVCQVLQGLDAARRYEGAE